METTGPLTNNSWLTQESPEACQDDPLLSCLPASWSPGKKENEGMTVSPPAPIDNILECIGNTPLVRLGRVAEGIRTPVYGKCEFMNPGASIKDRIGPAMIEDAERAGKLRQGGLIVEGTSGNTGVGLAMAAAIKGYRCIFTVPDKMSMEKIKLLRAMGAEVKVTPTVLPDHPDYYVTVAKRIAEENDNAVMANQFYNQANPDAHYALTGPELWEQTGGRVTHLVGSMGTGGTLSGTGRYLKEKNPAIKVIAGDPLGSLYKGIKETGELGTPQPYKVEGIGNDKLPTTCHMDVLDEVRSLRDKDAFQMARRLSREEGLFVGGSSGLNVEIALQVAREVDDPNAMIVAFLFDTGERYLSKLHSDEWMEENGFLQKPTTEACDILGRKRAGLGELLSGSLQTTVRQALGLMTENSITQLPIMEAEDCVGSVRESRLMARALEKPDNLDSPISEVMEGPFPVVDCHAPMEHVSGLFSHQNEAVLVRSEGKLTGIITRYDVIQHLSGR